MDLKDVWPYALPFITFFLGLLSGVIVPRLTAKRKKLVWSITAENDIVPKEISKTLGVPVVLVVGEDKPSSLSTVTVKLSSGGNEVIDKTSIAVTFNPESKVLNVRPIVSGEFQKYIQTSKSSSACVVSVEFLNPDQSVDVEILLSNYSHGSVSVDAASPGLVVQRKEGTQSTLVEASLMAFSMAGAGFVPYKLNTQTIREPGKPSFREITEELRGIREQLGEQLKASRAQHQAKSLVEDVLKGKMPSDEKSEEK